MKKLKEKWKFKKNVILGKGKIKEIKEVMKEEGIEKKILVKDKGIEKMNVVE